MENFNYGENLRITRQTKGVSQESMAWELKISQATYSRIESGKIRPDNRQSAKIEKILGIPSADPMIHLEELDDDSVMSIRGSGLNIIATSIFRSMATFIIKLALALALGNVAFEATSGACDALETSSNTALLASWIAGLSMMVYTYYWAGEFKKLQ